MLEGTLNRPGGAEAAGADGVDAVAEEADWAPVGEHGNQRCAISAEVGQKADSQAAFDGDAQHFAVVGLERAADRHADALAAFAGASFLERPALRRAIPQIQQAIVPCQVSRVL